LTANHVVDKYNSNVEYISWSKKDQCDKHVIGTEVPYRIPLRMRGDDEDNNEDEDDVEDDKDSEISDLTDDEDNNEDADDDEDDKDIKTSDWRSDYGDNNEDEDDEDDDDKDSETSDWRSDDEDNNEDEDGAEDYDKDSETSKWNDAVYFDTSKMAFDEQMLGDCIYDYTMNGENIDEEEQQQYDIACIKLDKQFQYTSQKMDTQNENGTKEMDKQGENIGLVQYNACFECCTTKVRSDDYRKRNLLGSVVVKLGSSKQQRGKIVNLDAAGEIKVGKKTAWVTNMVAIGADNANSDIDFTHSGDSGTVVCEMVEDQEHYRNCWMIFARLDNKWKQPVSIAFSLPDALDKLTEQVNTKDRKLRKRFRLSCCKKEFEQQEMDEESSVKMSGTVLEMLLNYSLNNS
ncbi:unnamed protein product, partial [Owenia fusiformis]